MEELPASIYTYDGFAELTPIASLFTDDDEGRPFVMRVKVCPLSVDLKKDVDAANRMLGLPGLNSISLIFPAWVFTQFVPASVER